MSGALLADAAGLPVIPVAHNAGDYWPRRRWLKRPGTIRVVIGPPIPTAGVDPRLVNERVAALDRGHGRDLARALASLGGAQTSRFATANALRSMNSRRGST